MGKFFNTLHVKASNREAFITGFEWIMKKEGFVSCADSDEAEVTFAAAFSEGGWVSLSNGEDSADELSKLSERLVKDLLLPSFTVEAVDSDFAIIELYSPNKKTKFRKSSLVVGDGEGYGVEEAPFSADDWKPLLQNGDIEKFLAVIGQNSTFVEDDLAEIGGLLGISSFAVTADYDELSGNEGAFSLSFKKAAEKKLTLNAAFKQVFGEALEPLGFKLIKSKFPYYVRVVPGGEIIHVITLLNERTNERGKKCFKIFGGIATVYRDEIDLTKNPGAENINWMRSNSRIAIATDTKYDFAYKGGFREFLFEADDESEMLYELNHSLDVTRKVMLPVISKAVDIDSSIECFFRMGMPLGFEEGFEGLLFLKTGNYVELFKNYFKKFDDEYKQKMEQGIDGYTFEEYKKELQRSEEVLQREISPIENVLNDPKLSAKYFAELERRKKENTEKLRGYGLEI